MKKLLVLAGLVALAPVSAHATHPFQDCEVKLDLAAMAKTLGGGVTQAVVSYGFDWSMTPFGRETNPSDQAAVASDGSASSYTKSVWSSLYERRLSWVKVEFRKDSSQAAPSYSVTLSPLNDPDEKQAKNAPVVCRTGAD